MKLVSLKLNEKFGILEAQEAKFTENPGGLIEIKAEVGAGKTTAKHATELAISAGNTQKLPFDVEKITSADVEVELSNGVFMRTYTDKKGNLKSVAYRKLTDGKIDKDPVIDGKKLTPAVLRDLIRTDLTFGIDNFLSENPKTHMDFMMGVYSEKLSKIGVVFDKNSPAYENSILWRLEQSKMNRENKHFARRAINGMKDALEKEGYDEENIPKKIDVGDLEAEKTKLTSDNDTLHAEATAKYYKDKEDLQTQLNEIGSKAKDYVNVCKAFNDNIENAFELEKTKLKAEIKEFNEEQRKRTEDLENADDALETLTDLGYDGKEVDAFIEVLKRPKSLRQLSELEDLKPSEKIKFTEDGKVHAEAYARKWSVEVDAALIRLSELKPKAADIIAKTASLVFPEKQPVNTEEVDQKIEVAKQSNTIIDRWNAFYDWQEADQAVKDTWKEYCAKYAEIDLGVPGLSIRIVGDEDNSSIRTHYDGSHNPAFFGNLNKEHRLLTKYSGTQRPVIAILMQIYLLSKKEDGLRAMWIECPIDKKTRDLLIDVQKKHDITIIVGVSGDYTFEGLEPGQFLIENGHLLTK